MIKKYLALLLTMTMLVLAAGCNTQSTDSEAYLPIHVGLLTDGGELGDDGFNRLAWQGLQALKTEHSGLQTTYRIPGADGSVLECVQALAQQGCGLIICVDGTMSDDIQDAAQQLPDMLFAVLDAEDLGLPNVVSLRFALEEAAYLAGVAAGKTTESDRVGCVHGRLSEETEQLAAAFIAGAKAANSQVRVLRSNILRANDGGNLATEELITKGVDVIFHTDADWDSAVIRACQRNGIWAIGAKSDCSVQAPQTVLTSAAKCIDAAVQRIVKNAATGQFQAGDRLFDLSNGGVGLVPAQSLMADNVLSSVNSYRDRIIAGEISIPLTLEEVELPTE